MTFTILLEKKKTTKNYSILKFIQDNANGENMIKRINEKFNYKQ